MNVKRKNIQSKKNATIVNFRKVFTLGGSVAITLPDNFCFNNNIGPGDYLIYEDFGTNLMIKKLIIKEHIDNAK